MGFNINRDEGFDSEGDVPEEVLEMMGDIEKQIEFHKNNILTANIEIVEDVVSRLMVSLCESLDEETGKGVMPLLSAIADSLIELRLKSDALSEELVEKKAPPPNDLGMN